MFTEKQRAVIDDTGTEIVLSQPAKRIVCLTATGLDILAELDLEPVGYLSQGVANKPEFYGDRAQQFTSVGSWLIPNVKVKRPFYRRDRSGYSWQCVEEFHPLPLVDTS